MAHGINKDTARFLDQLRARYGYQEEFLQAVEEVLDDVMPLYLDKQAYQDANILTRMVEPDRVITFRVCWEDDAGNYQVNRGYRVQFNNVLGPYKGGLRFAPNVNLSVLKFLGFEQCFKNALTGLPMGGGKGGANFDPKGKSEREIMRFCRAFMEELYSFIGPHRDVPAGDIGVGGREIGWMFGQYLKLTHRFVGALTGKGPDFGGSLGRKEATGYGTVYFLEEMLHHDGEALEGRRVAISGSGNVALYAAQKVLQKNGLLLCMSDSGGTVTAKRGFTPEQLDALIELKENRHGRIHELADGDEALTYHKGRQPWELADALNVEIALPCATQNEMDEGEARSLVKNGLRYVAEGANMPLTLKATRALSDADVRVAPGKAANAGGVAVSGLEMSQNALGIPWSMERVDEELHAIMRRIHAQCAKYGRDEKTGVIHYTRGANRASFRKLADAMLAMGPK